MLRQLSLNRFLSILAASLTVGGFVVIYCLSFAAIIFSGPLAGHISDGVGLLLLSAAVVVAGGAITSSYGGTIATPQKSTAALLALVVSGLAAAMPAGTASNTLFYTVVALLVVNSALTGLLFWLLGYFKLGSFSRYMPYPVIGGFLVGSSWLLLRGAVTMMAGGEWGNVIYWIPGVIFGGLLFGILQRYRSPLILPAMVVLGTGLFYGVLLAMGSTPQAALQQGLLLGPFPPGGLWRPITPVAIAQADWGSIVQFLPNLATIWLIDTVALLLNATGIELEAKRDLNLDHELGAAGLAAMVSSFAGGIGGFHSLSQSKLVIRIDRPSRQVGIWAAVVCVLVMIAGAAVLSWIPKLVVGGILVYLALVTLVEWLYDEWFKLPPIDYGLVMVIGIAIALWGLLQGITLGLLTAVVIFVVDYSRIGVVRSVSDGTLTHSHVHRPLGQAATLRRKGKQIHILRLQGLVFFGTAHRLLQQIRERLADPTLPPVLYLLLDFRLATGLDSSATFSFTKLKQIAQQQQISIALTHLSPKAKQRLTDASVVDAEGDPVYHLFDTLNLGLDWCEKQLLEQTKTRRKRFLPLAIQLKNSFPNPDLVTTLMQAMSPVYLQVGDYLMHQGEPYDGLYFMESGQLSVFADTPKGTKLLRTFRAGTVIGELGVYQRSPRSASVIADQGSRLYFLSIEKFTEIETNHALLAAALHRFIATLLAERLIWDETRAHKG